MQMIVGQKKQVGKISNDRQMKKINTHHKGKVYSACIKYITKQWKKSHDTNKKQWTTQDELTLHQQAQRVGKNIVFCPCYFLL